MNVSACIFSTYIRKVNFQFIISKKTYAKLYTEQSGFRKNGTRKN